MIRIKVFPLKKVIYRLEITLSYISFLILAIILIVLLLSQNALNLELIINNGILEIKENLTEEKLVRGILKRKIKIFDDAQTQIKEPEPIVVKNNSGEIQTKEETQEDDNELNVEKEENINVKIEPYEKKDKPEHYDVQTLEGGKIRVGSAIIKNYTKKNIDLEKLKDVSRFDVTEKTSFLIFHTHTSETYKIDSEKYSDFYRTEDQNYNIVSVGSVLAKALNEKGFDAVQDKSIHDYPSYNGAYKSSLETVQKILKDKKYDFVIDIHRDAISSNYNFRPTVEINGESVAKLMFVIGTNSSGLKHDEWMENLKLAIMIQNRAEEMYPGLFRELNLSKSRYNQHVSNGAMIVEVGATGNTLEEAKNSMKYLATVLDSLKK